MNYYISDLHICCEAQLQTNTNHPMDNRPFDSVEEQMEWITKQWNSKVTNGDHVYILGDLDKRGYNQQVVDFLSGLRGQLTLCCGNHDTPDDLRIRKQFQEIVDYKELTDKGRKLVLCHYPIFSWNGMNKGTIHLYGHVHGSHEWQMYKDHINYMNEYYKQRDGDKYKPIKAFNVGCMLWNFTPVTLDEILEVDNKINKKEEEIK